MRKENDKNLFHIQDIHILIIDLTARTRHTRSPTTQPSKIK